MRSRRLIPLGFAFAFAAGLALACVKPTPGPRLAEDVESSLRAVELARVPNAQARSLLGGKDAAVRVRAALAAGRIGDPDAIPRLQALLDDPETGETAAWALGRIEGGQEALARCLGRRCPAAAAAARALSGPAAFQRPSVDALVAALSGPAAGEAAISLGVLARNKAATFPPSAYRALALAMLHPGDARAGAAYALSRLPRGEGGAGEAGSPGLLSALRDEDPWTRSLAARAWGRQGLPAAGLRESLRDPDWRVRVEAARGLASMAGVQGAFGAQGGQGPSGARGAQAAPGTSEAEQVLQEAFAEESSPHVIVALSEAAAQLGVLPPDPRSFSDPTSGCAVAQARDRIRKQLIDTRDCEEEGWRSRARAGALAAELGLPQANDAFRDVDGRVRGAAAGAAAAAFAGELRRLLDDPDAYVVQEAAGTLAKFAADPATKEAALAAARRLAGAHARPSGDAQSDALTALVALTGPLPQLLPTPNAALAAALGQRRAAVPVPEEARALPRARVLRLRTSRGQLVIDLRPDVAPLTSSALAVLASRGFYDGLTFHRVVPDFVVQGGDPRGDGDGGPGWALPDEHGPLRFLRGTLGIATSGPETGGSQFFLCHSPQPHLDGRYTVAGQLRSGEDVLDALQPDDRILAASAE